MSVVPIREDASPFPSIPGELTETGLKLPENLPYDEWERVGKLLQTVERSVRWWIGDWLAFGERKYGEMYAQAIAIGAGGLSYDSLADAVWVSKKIEFSRRRENLSWSHHREVASLEPDAQIAWLEKAEEDQLSKRDLRVQIKARQKGATPTMVPTCRVCGNECKWCAVTMKGV